MIWTHLICSNFINFTLNIKQLLAQHIPLLCYTSLPSPWKLLDGFTEPFFRSVANTTHGQTNAVLHVGAISPQAAHNR
jgi:hypothetical protein